jgi:hypothetical protein
VQHDWRSIARDVAHVRAAWDKYLLSPVARSAETSQTILRYGRTLVAHLLKLEQGGVKMEPVYMGYQSIRELFSN